MLFSIILKSVDLPFSTVLFILLSCLPVHSSQFMPTLSYLCCYTNLYIPLSLCQTSFPYTLISTCTFLSVYANPQFLMLLYQLVHSSQFMPNFSSLYSHINLYIPLSLCQPSVPYVVIPTCTFLSVYAKLQFPILSYQPVHSSQFMPNFSSLCCYTNLYIPLSLCQPSVPYTLISTCTFLANKAIL